MTQALYRKWRPRRWNEVVGQEHIIQTLHNAVAGERFAHAFLFSGPRGTGKTTTARLLAKAVNCLNEDPASRPCDECEHCLAVNQGRFLDLIEIDAASNTSVDDVRSLREKINFSPNQGRYKVYIIDEVHMLSTAAFNALLKTLEEPPAHAIFVLATTEAHKIPATVLSRCQRHEFRRIPVNEIIHYLAEKVSEEQLDIDEDALVLIARQSTGCLRDAISLLDQLASTGEHIDLNMTQAVLGTAGGHAVIDLVDDVLEQKPSEGLIHLHRALDSGSDPRQFGRQIVEYLRDLLLIKMGNVDQVDATSEMRVHMARQAQVFETGALLEIIRIFNQAAVEGRGNWQPALPLELAFIEAATRAEETGAGAAPAQAVDEAVKTQPPAKDSPGKSKQPAKKAPAEAEPAVKPAAETREEALDQDDDSKALFQKIQDNWEQIVEVVRKHNPTAQGVLKSCSPLGIQKGMLLLGFRTEFVRVKLEQDERINAIRKALGEVIGHELPVRGIVAGGSRKRLPPEIDNEGMVAAAVTDLGGEIVDIH